MTVIVCDKNGTHLEFCFTGHVYLNQYAYWCPVCKEYKFVEESELEEKADEAEGRYMELVELGEADLPPPWIGQGIMPLASPIFLFGVSAMRFLFSRYPFSLRWRLSWIKWNSRINGWRDTLHWITHNCPNCGCSGWHFDPLVGCHCVLEDCRPLCPCCGIPFSDHDKDWWVPDPSVPPEIVAIFKQQDSDCPGAEEGQGVCAYGTPLSYYLVGDIHDTLYHMQENHPDHHR